MENLSTWRAREASNRAAIPTACGRGSEIDQQKKHMQSDPSRHHIRRILPFLPSHIRHAAITSVTSADRTNIEQISQKLN